MRSEKYISSKQQAGSFLIEAMISLLLFGLGIVAILGVATESLGQLGQNRSRTEASFLASELIGQMWVIATPATFDVSAWQTSDRVATALSQLGDGAVKVSGSEVAASGSEPCYSGTAISGTQVFICISWENKKTGARHFYRTSTEIRKNP